jgi:hypothetical protein
MNMVSGIRRRVFPGGKDAENFLSRNLIEILFVKTREQGFLDLAGIAVGFAPKIDARAMA